MVTYMLTRDRLVKAIASETGDTNVIVCLDEYGNAVSAKGGDVLLDLSQGFTLARVGKGSLAARSTDVEGLRKAIREAARCHELLARADSLISADGRFSVVDSPSSNTIWVRLTDDAGDMPPCRVEITVSLIHPGRTLVIERTKADYQTRREVESLLRLEEEQ